MFIFSPDHILYDYLVACFVVNILHEYHYVITQTAASRLQKELKQYIQCLSCKWFAPLLFTSQIFHAVITQFSSSRIIHILYSFTEVLLTCWKAESRAPCRDRDFSMVNIVSGKHISNMIQANRTTNRIIVP